ncbi:hypothetical protein OBBRIDRAFT_721754 [Obba rivulosa]|uniref:Uncharacterized protein n=1 Tax=Obba rivulosa TaxID=1052685 RepID=A0A8E2J571_9APHY|nr:hypothetical protein OBBRIDRAFT_721754 [Obba rivulosa]
MATSTGIQPFYGYVDTTEDALRLIEAARRGILPRVTRRLNELERRSMIRSGAVFVFSVEESGIKRWTEGLAWSQSRISGNFLVSRSLNEVSLFLLLKAADTALTLSVGPSGEGQGALKPNGLIKKTITVKIDGSDHHLISYYAQDDARSGRLQRPTSRPDLMALEIPAELLQSTNFRYPPRIQSGQDGSMIHISDADETDNQGVGTSGSASPVSPTTSRAARPLGEDSSGFPAIDFPLPLVESPKAYYSVQGRLDHHEALFPSQSSRNQPRVRQPVTAVPAHTGTPQYGGMQNSPLQHMHAAPWQASHIPPESLSTMSGESATYYSHLHSTQTDVSPAYAPERGSWNQRSHARGRAGRGTLHHHNIAQIDVTGQYIEGTPWPSDRLPVALIASAPPLTTPMTEGLPSVRGREHLRTRSFPPTWPWTQDGSAPAHYIPHGPHSADDDGSGTTASHLNQR